MSAGLLLPANILNQNTRPLGIPFDSIRWASALKRANLDLIPCMTAAVLRGELDIGKAATTLEVALEEQGL
ncbi:hypothetical protein M1105_03825 [Limibaculum sp. FT325]|uniref:hypothetical protein n=1 Tax=Thermohalobaculum sediminis TaxID=2939436 RepID=UPI0020BDDF22|nr:hypothetical protein [Limibaculum sediminis]MCL5776127.1 hypothetical protein [Limibaculum sediminis]